MAPVPHEPVQPYQAEPPRRLGCWWRLWIVFTAFWVPLALAMATAWGGWENGIPLVLLGVVAYPALTLLIGLSVAWIAKGRRK